MNKQVDNHVIIFFLWTFIFSWLLWLPGVMDYFGLLEADPSLLKLLEVVGALGPAVVALALTIKTSGRRGTAAMMKNSFNVRAHWKFWLGATLMLVSLHAAARLVLVKVAASAPPPVITSPVMGIVLFVVYFLVGGGLDEEIGWRGYALDRLQEHFSALNASFLLSAVWIVWHLPLFFYGGTNQSFIPFWLFILPVIALGIMLTWVYNNTHTIFAAAMFHTAGNICHDVFRVFPDASHPELTGFIIFTIFYIVAAVVIVLVYSPKSLQRRRKEVAG